MTLKYYLDDNVETKLLAAELARRGLDVERSTPAGNHAAPDDVHLAFAAATGRVLVTSDRKDFLPLHWSWVTKGRPHAGIVIVRARLSIGDRLRGLVALSDAMSAEAISNQLVFLAQWVGR